MFVALNANEHLDKMSRNNSELYSAYKISELLKAFKSNLLSLENKQKNYLLTGDPVFLEEYKRRESETKTYLKEMEKYFSGKPEEAAFFRLKDLCYMKLIEASNMNQQNNLAGFEGKLPNQSKHIMAEMLTVIDAIGSSLAKTTQVFIDNSVAYVNDSRKWAVLEVGFGVIVSLTALFLLLRDITIRNKLETELRIAKKQADENATLKEQFMANMSHEIRTPMNAILGFSDLMQKTSLSPVQAEYLSAIRSSGANLLNIINDILDFSKIEAGKLRIEKISFNLPALLDSLKVMFMEKARQKGLTFDLSCQEGVPLHVFGDPTRLTQILVNLLSNAFKFTEVGGVQLSCEVKHIEQNIAQLVFRVKDSGIGIPADKLDMVFERFNQGSKETTRKFGGTGLGLAIVKNLVDLQNGEIRVKSKPGQGSEFIVHLSFPVSQGSDAISGAIKNISYRFNKAYSILLADDNALNQKLAFTYLDSFGLKVTKASDGEETLDLLRNKSFDLVLLDIQMPKRDGYSTAQSIRRDLKLDLPVIAMTAHILEGEKEKCLKYGMNDYLAKPFREDELFDILARYLEAGIRSGNQDSENRGSNTETRQRVDFKELHDMTGGNRQFLVEMIELFLEKNPRDLEELENALAQTDYEGIRAISHRMKTSVGFMGLKHLTAPLNEMETLADQKEKPDTIKRHFTTVKNDCAIAAEEFQHALNDLHHAH